MTQMTKQEYTESVAERIAKLEKWLARQRAPLKVTTNVISYPNGKHYARVEFVSGPIYNGRALSLGYFKSREAAQSCADCHAKRYSTDIN